MGVFATTHWSFSDVCQPIAASATHSIGVSVSRDVWSVGYIAGLECARPTISILSTNSLPNLCIAMLAHGGAADYVYY